MVFAISRCQNAENPSIRHQIAHAHDIGSVAPVKVLAKADLQRCGDHENVKNVVL